MIRRSLPLLVLSLALAACGSSPSPGSSVDGAPAERSALDWSRPSVLSELPAVTLLGPAEVDAGTTPVFEWSPVDGATRYQLAVLGPEGVRWAWEGTATRIRYGGDETTAGSPQLAAGSWWNVVAVAASGEAIALSDMRPVSPESDRGAAPSWAEPVAQVPAASEAAPPASPVTADAASTLACDLLTAAEIASVIPGAWSEPSETVYPHGKGSNCEWTLATSQYGGGVSLSVAVADAFDPAGWGGEDDPMLDGLGDDAFLTRGGMDRRVSWLHGSITLTLAFDYGDPEAHEQFVAVARIVEEKLP